MADNETNSTTPGISNGKEGDSDWEEVLMMVEVPSGAKLNKSTLEDQYLHVLGLWSEEPIVKLDNMLYSGEIKNTLGSHLFVELKDDDDEEQSSENQSSKERAIVVTDKSLKLHTVDLLRKKDDKKEQP